MATVLELGLLDYFIPVFLFILVFTVLYAVLMKFKLFGTSQIIAGLIAFVMAIFVILIPEIQNIIRFMTPWVVLLFILTFFIIFLLLIFGVSEGSLESVLKEGSVVTIAIIFVIVLFFIAVANVYGPWQIQEHSFWKSFFTLRVLGAAFLLFVASFLVKYVAMNR